MSKVSRRTVDTGTSLVADGMGAKTLQFWSTQVDHSRPVTQPIGTHGRRVIHCHSLYKDWRTPCEHVSIMRPLAPPGEW